MTPSNQQSQIANRQSQITCPLCLHEAAPGPVSESGARESLRCVKCGATSRNRAVALAAVNEMFVMNHETNGRRIHRRLRVFQVGLSAVTDRLRKDGNVTISEFAPRPGCIVQDLEHLTFHTYAFDLVVCSDVLEHVRLYRTALAEMARVIQPEGSLILTVPLSSGPGHTEYCAVLDPGDPSKDVWDPTAPVHADPLDPAGCKVFRTYHAQTLINELADLGLSAQLTEKNIPDFGIVNAVVIVARKESL